MIPFDHPLCDYCLSRQVRLFAVYEKKGAGTGQRYACERHAAIYRDAGFNLHVPLHELPGAAEARRHNRLTELSAQYAKTLRNDPGGKER